MHCETLHDTCQDREMAVQFPNSSVERQKITSVPVSYISLSFSLTFVSFPHSCTFFSTFTFLSFLFSLVLFFSFCPILHFFYLLLFSALSLSLSLSLFLASSTSPPSSQLSCSGIVPDHSTSKYLLFTVSCPVFPSSRPCNIKVRGDSLCCFQWVLVRGRRKETESGKGESYVTHSRASKMNALWLNLPFSHLLLFRKSKPCSTAALKLHIKCEGCIWRQSTNTAFCGWEWEQPQTALITDYYFKFTIKAADCQMWLNIDFFFLLSNVCHNHLPIIMKTIGDYLLGEKT